MTNKSVKTIVKIEKKRYDVIYKSLITGNYGTYDDLYKGKYHDDDLRIKPNQVEPAALRERTGKNDRRLILDSAELYKPRCPYCYRIKIIELTNGRMSYALGNSFPVSSSKVDFGTHRYPRRRETSKYCDCCERTFVKEKVVIAQYA